MLVYDSAPQLETLNLESRGRSCLPPPHPNSTLSAYRFHQSGRPVRSAHRADSGFQVREHGEVKV
ncbi:hypothetical protein FIBSPDRAFT_853414 [Athelia psychrophila]|uniref:Uncharacterized protein n=1 Tax=Athelia psychrophila TaxID=1759441 RepID=A0A167X7S6_9AGAM|nr:hypothetical protein FIBSPDRAFT_876038 [Fibularhizoctonia sp. CBS 109695]KZP27560.1 hypothetical protein FIBSPDRAFT_853414 [Fibularhizoctonia sp. CBS 109695]